MIKHVVLVKVKPGTPQERIDAMVAGYNSMKSVIPELGPSWSMGENVRGDSDYTHVMVAVLDQAALQRYTAHPLHEQVARELGRPIFEKREIVDYEVDPQTEPWRPLM